MLYIYNIKFVNGENIKNDNFIVSCDNGSLTLRSGGLFRIVLGEINKSTIKNFAKVSDLNICYSLKTSLPSSFERLFLIISNYEQYINVYSYGKHTKFSNDCIGRFIYKKSFDLKEFNKLMWNYM